MLYFTDSWLLGVSLSILKVCFVRTRAASWGYFSNTLGNCESAGQGRSSHLPGFILGSELSSGALLGKVIATLTSDAASCHFHCPDGVFLARKNRTQFGTKQICSNGSN